ncbi:DUF6455 family protein [uncultured Pelagimonas sp.]|uniref:DUF6455 family protein n=1 Tax=uncultured Pelagimonas sp. TaxID=1618102 RepID=UPI0026146E39|nr:DUF6455 family protein [uncultured Pelagimonas sp.]
MTQHLGDPARHFFMTRSVARTMGLSLSEEMQTGNLAPESYARMVTHCRGCALVEACEKWLAEQVEVVTTPPPGCCNGEAFSQLRRPH